MDELTEVAVIDEAITWFEKRGTFTAAMYHVGKKDISVHRAGEGVAATCAVGGIEQAIWRLTGEVMGRDDRAHFSPLRDEIGIPLRGLSPARRIYMRVMVRLNRVTNEMYGDRWNNTVHTIEELTFQINDKSKTKRLILNVLRAAREEVAS